MASVQWQIRGIDTQGADLVLTRCVPWADGTAEPQSITSTHPPASGTVDALFGGGVECVFSAEVVRLPGFAITFHFSSAVELWGFRFEGPSPQQWPLRYAVASGDGLGYSITDTEWRAGQLSPAPVRALNVMAESGKWLALTGGGTGSWYGSVIADGGNLLVGCPFSGYVQLSRDGGVTWVSQTSIESRQWVGAAASENGDTLLVAPIGHYLHLSKDKGTTWTAVTAAGMRSWRCVGMSADGQTILASVYGSYMYLSKDAGVTWVAQTAIGSRQWVAAAVSDDGLTLFAGGEASVPTLSKDGGATWGSATGLPSGSWYSAAISSGGGAIIAANQSGYVYISRNAGTSWEAVTQLGTGSWRAIAISKDALVLVAGREDLDVLCNLSRDGGTAWEALPLSPARWRTAAVAHGAVLVGPSVSAMQMQRLAKIPPSTCKFTHSIKAAEGTESLQQGVGRALLPLLTSIDVEHGGYGVIHGSVELYVQAGNIPLPRRVRLQRSRDSLLVRETWSDAQGNYRFDHISERYKYDVTAWDHEGLQQSVVANDLTPEPMQ